MEDGEGRVLRGEVFRSLVHAILHASICRHADTQACRHAIMLTRTHARTHARTHLQVSAV